MKKMFIAYNVLLLIMLSFLSGYITCYFLNNKYDVNNDGEVDILDLLQLQKYLIERKEEKK